jgi:hypothetical protein
MRFNLSLPHDARNAAVEFTRLMDLGANIELKKVAVRRSLPQNRYLHLLLGAFGAHFGLSREEAKMEYKRVNKDLYFYRRIVMDETKEYVRSSRDLTKDQMTKSIERFRAFAELHGCPLPAATDQAWLQNIENVIEQMEQYL